MYAIGAQSLHQQMPGRMKTHIIQPLTLRVVAQQLGWKSIGQTAKLERLSSS